MIVTNITKTVELPHEPGESITIRKLSGSQLGAAAKRKMSDGIALMREIGAELVKALREGDTATVKRIEDAQAANVNNYDRDMLLADGVSAWSYPVPVAESLSLLDEDTAAFAAEQIFEFSRRRTAAEAKNV
jgi:hypothetical protein